MAKNGHYNSRLLSRFRLLNRFKSTCNKERHKLLFVLNSTAPSKIDPTSDAQVDSQVYLTVVEGLRSFVSQFCFKSTF